MKKRLICLLTCLALAASVSACTNDNTNKFYGESDSNASSSDFVDITKEYDLTIPTYDTYFELGEYKDLKYYIDDNEYVIDEDAIDRMILGELNIEPKSVTDRPIKKGDTVTLSLKGTIDGKAFDGNEVEETTIVIGKKKLPEDLENQLIGFEPNETRSIEYTFPSDYEDKTVAGKTAVFEVKIMDVKAYDLSIITDDIIKEKTDCETLDEYRKQAHEDIEKELAARKKTDAAALLLSQALENSTVKGYDTEMVGDLINSAKFASEQKAKQSGLTNDEYCQQTYGTTYDEYVKGLEDSAHDYLDSTMLLSAIAHAENIEVTDEEYQAQIQKFRDNGLSAKDISEGYTVHDIVYSILITKIQDWMLAHSEKSDTPV